VIELFDTSALILAARQPEAGRILADALAADEVALSEPILIEYLNGARNPAEYDRIELALRAARMVETTPADWREALNVHRALARSGHGHQRSVRLPDLIIAAVGAREGLPVVHYDSDYDRIASITGQATRWVIPRGDG
jgi:predicted nucleic acid-binding protein